METGWTDSPEGMTNEDKQAFLEAVGRFNEHGKSVYRENSLQEITDQIKEVCKIASSMTLKEVEGSFDSVTTKRHMKQLGESLKVFEATAAEANTLQQRLESAYDDIGSVLGKYYNIQELEESMDAVGAEDGDIDNDGDEDESDDYLASRRKVITRKVKK